MAKNQTKGRGQRQNEWLAQPHVNITMSMLLLPDDLHISEHFQLNMAISLALVQWLASIGVEAEIKWPNDLLIQGKKVCGILIENSVKRRSDPTIYRGHWHQCQPDRVPSQHCPKGKLHIP